MPWPQGRHLQQLEMESSWQASFAMPQRKKALVPRGVGRGRGGEQEGAGGEAGGTGSGAERAIGAMSARHDHTQGILKELKRKNKSHRNLRQIPHLLGLWVEPLVELVLRRAAAQLAGGVGPRPCLDEEDEEE